VYFNALVAHDGNVSTIHGQLSKVRPAIVQPRHQVETNVLPISSALSSTLLEVRVLDGARAGKSFPFAAAQRRTWRLKFCLRKPRTTTRVYSSRRAIT